VDGEMRWSTSGPVTRSARELIDLFLPVPLAHELVVGQMGQSLDGRIATEAGASHYITGREDIVRLHRLRALVDAVLVGTNTVVADDPQLTVREVVGKNPVRVVLDPRRRLSPDHRVFSDEEAATLVVRRSDRGAAASNAQGGGDDTDLAVPEIRVPEYAGGGLDLHLLLEVLRSRGLRKVLVEGGGRTVSSFLEAGALDRLHITVAPMLIGSGRPSIALKPIKTLEGALRPRSRCFRLGDDVLFDLDLRAAPE
jgi:diaminohydroxyphosphoribosylaminopyrimidine deaminase/5-amino-6-(5-phosphoribosylamino)uracil reductase